MLGLKIRELRKKGKLSQEEFAQIIGYSRPLIAKWESDERDPDTTTLIKIADYFNVSTDYLLGREDYYGNPYKSEKENWQSQRLPINELHLSDEETEMIKNYRNLHPEMQKFFYDSIIKLAKPRTLENI